MSDANLSPLSPGNQLLAALPPVDYERIAPHLEPVTLKLEDIVYRQGEEITHAYFPVSGMFSLVTILGDKKIEVGVVGREGMVSTSHFMGHTTSPLNHGAARGRGVADEASKLKEEFNRGGALQQFLLRYVQALYIQVSQTAACNQLHSLDERLARWLLMTHDRAQADILALKQEFLSFMLGVDRSRVTLAAISLQDAEIIKYSRGKIRVLSRTGLERAACECYGIVRKAMGTRVPG